MKVLTTILLASSMLVSLRLTGPAADSISVNPVIAPSGFIELDHKEVRKMEMLLNGNTFEFKNNDTCASLTFRGGNFVFVCQSSNYASPETLHGNYFFAMDYEDGSLIVVLRRAKAGKLFGGQKGGPLSFAHQMLSLNATLKIDCLSRTGISSNQLSTECLILKGFHVYAPRSKK